MRLVIDTDAGVDDAQAIMLALASPGVQVEAITTVTGNVHVDKVTRNVRTVLDVMGVDTPVYRGAELPLLADWKAEIPDIHGHDGLGDWQDRPETARPLEPEHAALALVRVANEAPGELTLVALGPLTNLALAARLDPAFPSRIKQFVFMGGTIAARGNTDSVTAEYNIFCDPEAAYIALGAFTDATMLSWETTLQHPFLWDVYDELAAFATARARFFGGISAKTAAFIKQFGFPGYLLPDPLAMAIALQPELIVESSRHYVTVELHGALTRAQTVIDYAGRKGRQANVNVVTKVDIDGVIALYRQALSQA